MASVQELKDALEAERGQAIKAAELALSSISTMTSLSQWVLAVMAIAIALLALIGAGVIMRSCRAVAERTANKGLQKYLETDIFKVAMDKALSAAVDAKVQGILVVQGLQVAPKEPEAQPFNPAPPEAKQ